MNEVKNNLASRRKRLGGALIDGLIAMVTTISIMFATGILQQLVSGQQMTVGQRVGFFLVGWLVFLILNGYLLATKGKTIGKVVVKTRIVDMNGHVPGFGKLLILRYLILGLVAQIPIFGILAEYVDVLFIFGKERRCIHDYIAGTWVING